LSDESKKQQDGTQSDRIDAVLAGMRRTYMERRRKNHNYSLRAFARDVGVAVSTLSEIFAGKKSLTTRLISRLVCRLDLTESELRLIRSYDSVMKPEKSRRLAQDEFRAIAEWHHYAILSLLNTSDFQSDSGWMALRLGISRIEVEDALERLEALRLIRRQGGAFVRNVEAVMSGDQMSGASKMRDRAIRMSHRQSIQQALFALDHVDTSLRDFSALTVAFDQSQLPIVQSKIREFLISIRDITKQGLALTEVYNLNVQFVPVTKISKP
jgi:transcriptional regulator with XRE-family HTH domain